MIRAGIDMVIATGRSQLGQSERPSNSNRQQYGDWYGMNGVAWCAIWVSWVFWHAGYGLPNSIRSAKGFAYCPDIVTWAQKNGTWRRAGSYRPKRGDIILFSFGGKRADHVGIVQGVLPDGRIHTLEGNSNAGGSRTGGSVVELYRRTGILGYVVVEDIQKPAEIDWAAVRRLAAGQLRNSMGEQPSLPEGEGYSLRHVLAQNVLNFLSGANLTIDGIYGEATAKAVLNFQAFLKIPVAIPPVPGTSDFPGAIGDVTRFVLCVALDRIRDGQA